MVAGVFCQLVVGVSYVPRYSPRIHNAWFVVSPVAMIAASIMFCCCVGFICFQVLVFIFLFFMYCSVFVVVFNCTFSFASRGLYVYITRVVYCASKAHLRVVHVSLVIIVIMFRQSASPIFVGWMLGAVLLFCVWMVVAWVCLPSDDELDGFDVVLVASDGRLGTLHSFSQVSGGMLAGTDVIVVPSGVDRVNGFAGRVALDPSVVPASGEGSSSVPAQVELVVMFYGSMPTSTSNPMVIFYAEYGEVAR